MRARKSPRKELQVGLFRPTPYGYGPKLNSVPCRLSILCGSTLFAHLAIYLRRQSKSGTRCFRIHKIHDQNHTSLYGTFAIPVLEIFLAVFRNSIRSIDMGTSDLEKKSLRIDKELWLRTALNAVAHTNGDKISIDALAKKLGKTKGSFYHHFRNRQDLVDQIVEYWVQHFNVYVMEAVVATEGSGEEKLRTLMRMLNHEGLDLYDTTFRAWGAKDPEIAAKVLEVDVNRYKFLKNLFSQMGFVGEDLETRTRMCLIFLSGQAAVNFPDDSPSPGDFVAHSHEFFIRR